MDDEKFIEGKIVYLRAPNIQKDVWEGEWHSWFNDPEVTKYLTHGIFPVSREQQAKFVEEQLGNRSTLLLSIIDQRNSKHIGVISLKSIDLINKTAEIAIVIGKTKLPGAALEAMALMTQHAFERLNLQRLYAGQHEGLWKWVNSLELIGYKIEGYRKNAGMRNGSYDTVLTAITSEDYFQIKKKRGSLIPVDTKEFYKARRKENLLPVVKEFFESLYKS